jgi:hypothetical protein
MAYTEAYPNRPGTKNVPVSEVTASPSVLRTPMQLPIEIGANGQTN